MFLRVIAPNAWEISSGFNVYGFPLSGAAGVLDIMGGIGQYAAAAQGTIVFRDKVTGQTASVTYEHIRTSTINVSPGVTELRWDNPAGFDITVQSGGPWTLTSGAGAISVSPTSGGAGNTVVHCAKVGPLLDGQIYQLRFRNESTLDSVQHSVLFTDNPATLIVSNTDLHFTPSNTTQVIQVESKGGGWEVWSVAGTITQAPNGSVSPTSGAAGVTNVTLFFSPPVTSASGYVRLRNQSTGEIVPVNYDWSRP